MTQMPPLNHWVPLFVLLLLIKTGRQWDLYSTLLHFSSVVIDGPQTLKDFLIRYLLSFSQLVINQVRSNQNAVSSIAPTMTASPTLWVGLGLSGP